MLKGSFCRGSLMLHLAVYAGPLGFAIPVSAGVNPTGDVSPANPASWTSSTMGFIGNYSTGTLLLNGGSQVTDGNGIIGYSFGSTGAVTVTGAGSTWTNGTLSVGGNGNGTLSVENGGTVVSQSSAAIGGSSGSVGQATITGAGSSWTNTKDLSVGPAGFGTLTVDTGGVVNTGTLVSLPANLRGDGTINTRGLVSDTSLTFDATHGLQQTFSFGTAGTLNLNVDGTGKLGVGYGAAATMRIADGKTVLSTGGFLGVNAGSVGAATVTGAGSTWTNSGELYVGQGGAGTLTVDSGAVVNTVTLYAASSDVKGSGTINTQGLVSDVNLVFDATHGLQQTLGFGTGGVLNLDASANSPAAAGAMGVGYAGQGTLRIADGKTILSSVGALGVKAGSAGTATVIGAGSTWNTGGGLAVGQAGAGTLMIANGGTVLTSGVFNIGGNAGSMGQVTVTGPGSSLGGGSMFTVGGAGTGTLLIEHGGSVSTSAFSAAIAGLQGSVGQVTVTGAGSTWTIGGSLGLNIGQSGTGTLTIADGGQVTAPSVTINSSTSSMNLHVSGNNMLVLGGNAGGLGNGNLSNFGSVNLYADASLSPGTYTPISAASGSTLHLSSGVYNAFGGTWNGATGAFNVAAPTSLAAGVAGSIATGQRLSIADAGGLNHIEASFSTVASGATFEATPMTSDELSSLAAGGGQSVLSGWDFTTNLTGTTVLLSFDVGPGASNLEAWHYSGGVWTPVAGDVTYSNGIASFTVNSFSGYALTGVVPEPVGLGSLALAGLGLLRRRRAEVAAD